MSSNNIKVRIAIVGETGCGKSTLINALLGKIVLPESPMTSTPILTHIEYLSKGEEYAEIIDVNQQTVESLNIEEFIRKYCFNVEEQREVDRKRFLNISHAVLHINSNFLKTGVQLVDTMGFSAASHDTEMTESVFSSETNLVFYVLAKNMLKDSEIERIQNLLGYRTSKQIANDDEEIQRKISLSKLYFICNEKEEIISKGLVNSICRIFYSEDCNKSNAQIENFTRDHILRCNFLVARTLSSGIYPYSKYFSDSPSKEEAEFAEDMERRQKQYLRFGNKDEEYIMWKKTRKSIHHIVEKKQDDIEQHRINSRFSSYIYRETDNYSDKFRLLLDEANRGITGSQVLVGLAYEYGDEEMNVPVDLRQAFLWYQKAAESGDSNGQYCFASMYYEGILVPQDFAKAFIWYEKAAKQGHDFAKTHLGVMYDEGKGVEQNYAEALKWYKSAAEDGNSYAQFFMAEMYATGNGVEQDYTAAFRFYRKSAEAGNSGSMYCLGMMYENGNGVIRNRDEAFKWYKKAADSGYEDAIDIINNWK